VTDGFNRNERSPSTEIRISFRLDPSYCTGVFSSLLDDKLLEQATVQYGAVAWSNGLDLAPDTMSAAKKM
jgi:hypothetical protein